MTGNSVSMSSVACLPPMRDGACASPSSRKTGSQTNLRSRCVNLERMKSSPREGGSILAHSIQEQALKTDRDACERRNASAVINGLRKTPTGKHALEVPPFRISAPPQCSFRGVPQPRFPSRRSSKTIRPQRGFSVLEIGVYRPNLSLQCLEI